MLYYYIPSDFALLAYFVLITYICSYLPDRMTAFISGRIDSNIVLYYYRASLVSLTICSSLAYILTSSGKRLTATSMDCARDRPSSFDSHSRLFLNVSSVRMVNTLSLFMIILHLYIHFICIYICMDIFVYTFLM